MKQRTLAKREIEVHRVTETACDLCGRTVAGDSWDADPGIPDPNFDNSSQHSHADVVVSLNYGQSYPETGWAIRYEPDICPACFMERLLPWLREQGAKVEPEQSRW